MGFAKQEGLRWEGLVQDMTAVAVRAGSMELCPHDEAIDLDDPQPAYDLADKEYKAGKLSEFRSPQEVKDALDEVFQNAGECASCAKMYDD